MRDFEKVGLSFSKERKIPVIRVNPYDRSKPGEMVSVVSYTAAGEPVDSQERYFGHIFIPEEYAVDKRIMASYVKGDSMVDAGIEDGDVVLIRQKSYPRSGEIGICIIPQEGEYGATCKKIRLDQGRWRLISMNHKKGYPDIMVQDMRYVGEVVAIYKEEVE